MRVSEEWIMGLLARLGGYKMRRYRGPSFRLGYDYRQTGQHDVKYLAGVPPTLGEHSAEYVIWNHVRQLGVLISKPDLQVWIDDNHMPDIINNMVNLYNLVEHYET